MRDALTVEWLKLRRSPVARTATAVAVGVIPILALGFVNLADSPGQGALGLKVDALVVGTGWDAYLGVLGQLVAVANMLAVGVVVVWCFGREFSDRTIGALFALPTPRERIGLAKFAVLAAWAVAMSITLVTAAALLGWVMDVGSFDAAAAVGVGRLLVLALLTAVLTTPLAVAASAGRGFLPGIGILLMIVASAQIAVLFGAGAWYPFAAPGLWMVGWQEPDIVVTPLQLAMVPLAGLAGVWLTTRWWGRFELV